MTDWRQTSGSTKTGKTLAALEGAPRTHVALSILGLGHFASVPGEVRKDGVPRGLPIDIDPSVAGLDSGEFQGFGRCVAKKLHDQAVAGERIVALRAAPAAEKFVDRQILCR